MASLGRREFLHGLTAAATVSLAGAAPSAGEPPPETPRLRIFRPSPSAPGVCTAPQFVAEELLRAEGFTDVRYVTSSRGSLARALAVGDIDLSMRFVGLTITEIDSGDPVVMIGGVHVGCYELFASDRIRSIRNLKGKAIGVTEPGSGSHLFLLSALAYVGLDPNKDVTLVTKPAAEGMNLFATGKLDAFQAFSEEVQELRARKIGHVLLNSATDRPWSQYFCCMVIGNREFVQKHPVATKRALRAILKATDVCALEPERAARSLVDGGFAPRYDYALQTMRDVPYGKWREYDPEDTLRFYALRLHEAGMIKSTPQKLIAQGTDWRFLHELKKELKG
jgi:NitT/TauT family transport system substrate-binding protein